MKKTLFLIALCSALTNAYTSMYANIEAQREELTLADQLHIKRKFKADINYMVLIMEAYLNLSEKDKHIEKKAAKIAAKNIAYTPLFYTCKYKKNEEQTVCKYTYDQDELEKFEYALLNLENKVLKRLGECVDQFGKKPQCYAKSLYFEKKLKEMLDVQQQIQHTK